MILASWCWICRRKVGPDYRWYKRDKAHPGCIKIKKESEKKEKDKRGTPSS